MSWAPVSFETTGYALTTQGIVALFSAATICIAHPTPFNSEPRKDFACDRWGFVSMSSETKQSKREAPITLSFLLRRMNASLAKTIRNGNDVSVNTLCGKRGVMSSRVKSKSIVGWRGILTWALWWDACSGKVNMSLHHGPILWWKRTRTWDWHTGFGRVACRSLCRHRQ